MREILFHGKRADNGEWITGFYAVIESDGKRSVIVTQDDIDGGLLYWTVDPDTVGQYTGLTDKKGKKIFEGNIVRVFNDAEESEYVFCVSFGKCGGVENTTDVGYQGFYFEPYNEETKRCAGYGLRDDIVYWISEYPCEVIGSIHEQKGA